MKFFHAADIIGCDTFLKVEDIVSIPLPPKDAGYPFVQILGNRLKDIEDAINRIIKEIDAKVFSPSVIKTYAI